MFLDTPLYEFEPLSDALGVRLQLKVETLNPIRSFKGRGAELFVGRYGGDAPLVCASAGSCGPGQGATARAAVSRRRP